MDELTPPAEGLLLAHFIASDDLELSTRPRPGQQLPNIRVADIRAVYAEWSARGAQCLTPPRQHQYEIRSYIRDVDGYLIEVGQTTDPEGDWSAWS